MTKDQFEFYLQKLKNVYGENNYPKERSDLLYQKFKNIPLNIFNEGIESMILNCKFAPLLKEFHECFDFHMRPSNIPSRFNTNSGYKKTTNGVSGKEASRRIGDILKEII